MIWGDIDLDALEAELDDLESDPVGVAALSDRELEDAIALLSLEVLQLTSALEGERRLRRSQAVDRTRVADLEGEVCDLRRALAVAEARAQDATARAEAAEAEASSLRAELEAARAGAPAWTSIRDRHAADYGRRAL